MPSCHTSSFRYPRVAENRASVGDIPAQWRRPRAELHRRIALRRTRVQTSMDDGLWTMDDGRWTMDHGPWTMDPLLAFLFEHAHQRLLIDVAATDDGGDVFVAAEGDRA